SLNHSAMRAAARAGRALRAPRASGLGISRSGPRLPGPHGRRCLAGQTLYSNGTSADLYARSTEAASGASNTQTHWDPSSFTNEVTQLTWLLRRHGLSRSFQPSRPSVWTAGL